MTRTCTDIHIDACKGAVRCGPGPRWIRVDMGREFFFFFSACMRRTNYVCVNFCGNTSVLIVFEFVRGAIVSWWHAYLCLSSAQLCPNLTYARMCAQVHFHVCTADILRCVCACVQKRKKKSSVQMCI